MRLYYGDKEITSESLIAEVIYTNNQIKTQEEIRQTQEMDRQEAYTQSLSATSACITATELANDATYNANAVATQLENETLKIPKPAVTNFSDLATTYPTPVNGWTVTVTSESVSYRYSSTLSQWINIGYISTAEIATDTQVGLVKSGGNVVIDGTGKMNVLTVGDVATLTTTDKSSTVGAINELNTNIGDLSTLTTESNTDLVGAINEVDERVDKLDVLTTEGDIIYRGATVPIRLAKGTAGQVLTMNSGANALEWKTPTGGGGENIDTINVKDFGAIGDGVTDDTPAINAALSYAVKNNKKCVFPVGLYATYGDFGYTFLDTEVNTKLVVEGLSGSKILFLGDEIEHKFWLYGNYKTDAIVRGLTIIGSKGNPTSVVNTHIQALRVNRFQNVLIEDCVVDNFEGEGIMSGDNKGIVTIRNNRVLNCGDLFNLAYNDAFGDGIYTHENNQVIIEGNYVYNDIEDVNATHKMGRVGICTEYDTKNATIRNNTIFGYNRAIHVELDAFNSSHVIENNKTFGSPCGIMVWSEKGNITIRNNDISNEKAFKARSSYNQYGTDGVYGYGIAFLSGYNNTNVTIEDNVVKGKIASDIFMMQPIIFPSTTSATNEEGQTGDRLIDNVNILRNIFDCGLRQLTEYNAIYDDTVNRSSVIIPAESSIVSDNYFNIIGAVSVLMSAAIKSSAFERNTVIQNGLYGGLTIRLYDGVSALYTQSQNNAICRIKDNNFVIKGKNTDWHDLGLDIINVSTLSTLIIENNVFNFATNAAQGVEIGLYTNWLYDDIFSKLEFSNNTLMHRGGLSVTYSNLGRRATSRLYNTIHNVITNVKTKLFGTSPFQEGKKNVQYLANTNDPSQYGKYWAGDVIRYDDDSRTVVTGDGYITSKAWTATTAFTAIDATCVNPFIYSGSRVFKCTVSGMSGGTVPATFATANIGDNITDGTVTWKYVGGLATTSNKA